MRRVDEDTNMCNYLRKKRKNTNSGGKQPVPKGNVRHYCSQPVHKELANKVYILCMDEEGRMKENDQQDLVL